MQASPDQRLLLLVRTTGGRVLESLTMIVGGRISQRSTGLPSLVGINIHTPVRRYMAVSLVCTEADRWEHSKLGQRRPRKSTSESYDCPHAAPSQYSVCMCVCYPLFSILPHGHGRAAVFIYIPFLSCPRPTGPVLVGPPLLSMYVGVANSTQSSTSLSAVKLILATFPSFESLWPHTRS